MNTLVIPPSPNWYETAILACAPDNSLIYGARNEIVLICDSPKDQASDIKIIPRAHSQKITSVNLNKNWGHPNKLLVTVGEDKLVKLWDVEILEKKLSHSVHRSHSKISGATFAGDERIISVSEEGVIVVWNLGLNQTTILKDVFGFKVTVTCISTCPHANWLTAFGLKNGLVVVTDLRKQGKVLYKLRGHDKSVISLAWCPAPLNIFPKDPHNYVGAKKIAQDTEDATENFSAQKPFVTNDKPVDKQLELGNIEGNTQTTTEELREIEKNNITDDIEACGSRENTSRNIEELNKTDEKVEEFDGASTSKNEHEAKKDICVDKKKSDSNVPKDEEKNRAHPLLRIYDSEDDFLKECKKLLGNTSPENIYGTVSDKANIENGKVGFNKDKTEVCPDIQILKESIAVEKQMSEGDKEMDIDTLESTENTLESSLFVEVGSVNESLIEEKAMSDIVNDSNYETSNGTVREIPRNVSVEEQPRKEFLLASSAKEGNIYIWRAGTDGRMQTFFSAPNKSGNRRSKTHSDKLWITLCWPSPTMLLSSSKLGELLQWTLPKPKDKSKLFRVIHKDHSSLLFSIAGPVTILNEQDWTNVDEKALNVWTVGQDRLLLNTSLSSERTNLACYPTVGAVECFASSPLDPSRLAIGTGEGIIKIWDLSRPHVKNVLMSNFYQKIQSKVVTLAWHPTNELLLAYGTLEGRIGYFDVSNKSKSPVLLPNFFKSQIHKIEWGPLNGDIENLGLFAVAEGKLITFNVKKSANDPQEVDTPDNTFVYTFSWKPDYQILLVSSKTGTLIVYSSDLKILATHYLQRKLQTICWHPDATQSDPSVTKYCNWFASVYNSKEILVYDFGIETDNSEDRIPTQLVVACDDGTTEIWDASSSTVLSTYINAHFEGVLAVTWSPIDSDYVIIAGKDHTIRIWKVSDCPPRTNEEIVALKKKCVKEVSEDADLVPKKEKASSEEATKVKKTNKNNLLPNFYSPKDNSEIVADLHKLLSWKENSQSNEPQVDQDSSILKIFGSSADMLKIIQTNEASHKARGKYNLRSTLSLFRGDISTTIKRGYR
ncbi:hypothetical protein NQ318_005277 [Aromia moschata]|uniref:Gem-associated protein 5 n=1 Tax=Aromia moschata TaxID=1265417 RepID=A0AAV8Y2K7_9CUCU|nr:hypothetical protein NQ318_005277 [Aromia moschata]